ncbi:hypothetical protein D3C76_242660 [compost metagenome]
MEETFLVKQVGVKYKCDQCENGEMRPTGKMIMHETHATFVHRCDNCESEIDLKEKYPLIRYDQI